MKRCPVCKRPSDECRMARQSAANKSFSMIDGRIVSRAEIDLGVAERRIRAARLMGQGIPGEGNSGLVQSDNVSARHIACGPSCPICKGIHLYFSLSQGLNSDVSRQGVAADKALGQKGGHERLQSVDSRGEIGQIVCGHDGILKRLVRRIGARFGRGAQ